MGSCGSAARQREGVEARPRLEDLRVVEEKMKLLQREISEMMEEREREGSEYEKDVMVFAFKESEWRHERRRLREEVRRLRKAVEDKDDKKRVAVQMEEEEERAWRDEAVDKWKKLYLAIKKELDDLIHRTHQGGVYWGSEEEDMVEELNRELQQKEDTIKALKTQLASAEREGYKSKRDADILRQSLRIISSHNNKHQKIPPTGNNSSRHK